MDAVLSVPITQDFTVIKREHGFTCHVKEKCKSQKTRDIVKFIFSFMQLTSLQVHYTCPKSQDKEGSLLKYCYSLVIIVISEIKHTYVTGMNGELKSFLNRRLRRRKGEATTTGHISVAEDTRRCHRGGGLGFSVRKKI